MRKNGSEPAEKLPVTTPEHLYDSGLTLEIDPLRALCHLIDQTVRDHDPHIQLLIQQVAMPPEHFDALCQARLGFLQLAGRSRKIADFYCVDGTANLKLATYELRTFLSGFTKTLNNALGVHIKGDVTFKCREEGEIWARFDADRVCAILYNLVDNALLHGNTDNKNVYISLKTTNDTISISVKDKGQGIPEQEKPVLFKKYAYNFSTGTFPPSNLKGLGLALCRKYAREMGGEITFQNQKIGAKFTLTLPRTMGAQKGFREAGAYDFKLWDLYCFLSEALMMVDRMGQK